MPQIVDTADFKGSWQLPITTQTVNILTNIIEEFETSGLRKILGYELAEKVLNGEANEIMSGGTYIDIRGKEKPFESIHKSLVPYIYYQYVKNESLKMSGSGPVVAAVENSTVAAPEFLMVKAWNAMVDNNYGICHFINSREDLLPFFEPEHSMYKKINTLGI